MQPPGTSHGSDQGPVNARAIEPAAVASWPAREKIEADGWLLRFTDGYSQRANSVATHRFSGGDLDTAIEAAEKEYRARNLAPLFQITPVSQPAGLEAALQTRGYEMLSPAFVMRAQTGAVRVLDAPGVKAALVETENRAFTRLVVAGSHSPEDGAERMFLLSRIALPHACLLAFDGDMPVACGVCVIANGLGGIYLMRTDAAWRRRGYGKAVLKVLAQWASNAGAAALYLQAEDANAPARALYARMGFAEAYSYRFWRQP